MRLALIAALALSTLAFADTPEPDQSKPDAKSETDAPEAKPEAPKVPVGTTVGKRLPHFKATAHTFGDEPAQASHDSHALERPTVYVFMNKSCPYCTKYAQRLADMAKVYKAKGADFVMVYPVRKRTAEQKVAYHKASGFHAAALVVDEKVAIAKALKIKKTPEVVLVDKHGVIKFRGGIDDNPFDASKVKKPFLRAAIDAVIAGEAVQHTTAPLFG